MNSLYLILTKLRYFGPAWVFASLNIMTSTWVLYIPQVRTKLGIDDAQLGVALFCFGLGTLAMIPLAPKITDVLGIGKTTFVGIVVFSLLFLVPLVMPTYSMLCITLFIVGLSACLTDVAMNALVSQIEQEDEVHIMSSSHGFFSLGGVIGAVAGGFLITYFEVPFMHMLSATVVVILTNGMVSKAYISIKGKEKEATTKSFDLKLIRPLLGLTIIAFLVMGSEGAIEHWSKLYMQDIVMITSEKVSGFSFVAFSAMMTLGRFFGDSVSKYFGSLTIIITGCLISVCGFLGVLEASLITAVIGFGLVGLGFSVIIPELFRMAGKVSGVSSTKGISFVAGFGYLGFLLSPPLLGLLSKLDSLKLSFMALLVAAVLVLIVSLFISKSRSK